ncbi:MAG: hypothetical protein ABRQ37_20920 [Candidatus Eremiobacterota bacterium]
MRGHSTLELMMTTVIFSTFLLAITAIFSTGLKSWNLVQNKTETQQESSICMNFLQKDLSQSDRRTAIIGGKGKEYAILQSAMNDRGIIEYNHYTGDPKWQAYILYYTLPRDSSDKTCSITPSDERKRLVRKVIRHKAFTNTKLTDFELYFYEPNSPPMVTGEEYIGMPRVLSRHIYEMILTDTPNSKFAIDINIILEKSILEDRLAFQKDFSENGGKEKIIRKSTIILKNTED